MSALHQLLAARQQERGREALRGWVNLSEAKFRSLLWPIKRSVGGCSETAIVSVCSPVQRPEIVSQLWHKPLLFEAFRIWVTYRSSNLGIWGENKGVFDAENSQHYDRCINRRFISGTYASIMHEKKVEVFKNRFPVRCYLKVAKQIPSSV